MYTYTRTHTHSQIQIHTQKPHIHRFGSSYILTIQQTYNYTTTSKDNLVKCLKNEIQGCTLDHEYGALVIVQFKCNLIDICRNLIVI